MGRDKIKIQLDDRALNKQIDAAMERNPTETVKAVKECALHLSGNSAIRAPVDMGDLRNNCHADLNGATIFENQRQVGGAPASTVAVSDVGYSLPYALRQHEELSYNHPKGGEAKYLEKPFDENKARYIKRIHEIPDRSLK